MLFDFALGLSLEDTYQVLCCLGKTYMALALALWSIGRRDGECCLGTWNHNYH